MILDDKRSYFIYVCHPEFLYAGAESYLEYKGKRLTNKEYLEHWGKWIIMDDRRQLDILARKLEPYVDSKAIAIVKYDRFPPKNLGGQVCAMLVFCDDRQRDEVWQILSGLGVTLKAWVYDRQTMEMWMPGGVLLESWITEQELDSDKAKAVREDARRRFSEMFKDDDAHCRAWEAM